MPSNQYTCRVTNISVQKWGTEESRSGMENSTLRSPLQQCSTVTLGLSLYSAWNELRVSKKKTDMPSKRLTDGEEVMRSSILAFSEEMVHGLLLILACSSLACMFSCSIKNIFIFVGKMQLSLIKNWFYDISAHHSKQHLQAGHFKHSSWQNLVFQENLSLYFPLLVFFFSMTFSCQ